MNRVTPHLKVSGRAKHWQSALQWCSLKCSRRLGTTPSRSSCQADSGTLLDHSWSLLPSQLSASRSCCFYKAGGGLLALEQGLDQQPLGQGWNFCIFRDPGSEPKKSRSQKNKSKTRGKEKKERGGGRRKRGGETNFFFGSKDWLIIGSRTT